MSPKASEDIDFFWFSFVKDQIEDNLQIGHTVFFLYVPLYYTPPDKLHKLLVDNGLRCTYARGYTIAGMPGQKIQVSVVSTVVVAGDALPPCGEVILADLDVSALCNSDPDRFALSTQDGVALGRISAIVQGGRS